jgi:hypothetical protein
LNQIRAQRSAPSGLRPKNKSKNAASAFTGVGGGPSGGRSKKSRSGKKPGPKR